METPNYYEERSKKPSEHKNTEKNKVSTETKEDRTGDLPAVIKNVMADAGLAVLGGGFTSAMLGRLSLPVGLLLTGYGHYKKNSTLRILGIGIMASSSMTNRIENNPKATFVENTTNRIKAFADELKSKLGLDLLAKQAAIKKETKPVRDLSGTQTKQTPAVSTSNNSETQAPDAIYFESIKKEAFENAPPLPIKEINTKKMEARLSEELEGLSSIDEKLY